MSILTDLLDSWMGAIWIVKPETFIAVEDRGFRSGKLSPSKLPGIAASMFPAKGQEAIIRVYRKDYFFRDKQLMWKIYFEVYSQGEYVAKHFTYSSAEIERQLHRHHHYRVQFNDNPRYPMIEAMVEEIQI